MHHDAGGQHVAAPNIVHRKTYFDALSRKKMNDSQLRDLSIPFHDFNGELEVPTSC